MRILCALIAAALLAGCEKSAPESQPAAPLVKTVSATPGAYYPQTRIIARVYPLMQISVVARVSGVITARNFVEGTYVPEGTVLYEIDPRSYEIALAQAQATLAQTQAKAQYANVNFARAQTLFKEKVDSAQEFDIAQSAKLSADAAVAGAQADVNQAQLNLDYTKIVAPFSGWVGLTTRNVGNYLDAPSPALTTLAYIDTMRVKFNLSESMITPEMASQLQSGTPPVFNIALLFFSGERYELPGKLEFWNNQINPSTGTLELEASFANPKRQLLPGQYAQIELTPPEAQQVLWVDERAVREDETGAYVYVVNADGIVERRQVTRGATLDNRTILSSGVAADEQLVAACAVRLKNDMKVDISREPLK